MTAQAKGADKRGIGFSSLIFDFSPQFCTLSPYTPLFLLSFPLFSPTHYNQQVFFTPNRHTLFGLNPTTL
jgi:hypothetical protein